MKQKTRILWIEDEARYDLALLAAPVIMDRRFDLVVAETASEGIARLLEDRYDVIIVDIRLDPGENQDWVKLDQQSDGKVSARLGLHLLYTVLGHDDAKITLGDKRPTWLKPEMIGVLSVETEEELSEHLTRLNITKFHHKSAASPPTVLLEMVESLLQQSAKSTSQSVADVPSVPGQQTGEHQ
jgi:DNA-binding NarL/FixJ family response regulator